MPELPDVVAYVEALERHVVGDAIEAIRMPSVSLLRTYDPPIEAAIGRPIQGATRMGKRIVLSLEGDLHLVLHLMVAGRLRWRKPGAGLPGKATHAAFDLARGTLVLTEQGSRKRASLHVVAGRDAVRAHDPGGLEVADASEAAFAERLRSANHTLKRALANPRSFSGIGGAYADEILFHARLSPLQWTSRLADDEVRRLWRAAKETLRDWTQRVRAEVGDGFPDKVTAFRDGMAVHGRYRKPCPRCEAPVQRIVYQRRETNYCAPCQTDGRVLADRALSRLLKGDWPRSIEDWEALSNG